MFRNMSSEEQPQLDITDPKAMRALAHPVRLALLDLFKVNQTLTATQAGELLGESPANAAFHLRTLGRYGFVEETGGGRGRERPWRAVSHQMNLTWEQADPQAAVAAQVLHRSWSERVLERAQRGLDMSRPMPKGWEEARQAMQDLTHLTAAELTTLGEEILALMNRYGGREDPATRPEGAEPVELLFFGYPLTGLVTIEADVPDREPGADPDAEPDGQSTRDIS
jgi:predicted transcriptional regulator